MWKICLTAALAVMMFLPACSDAPPPKEEKPDEGKSATSVEFNGKDIRVVGKHHYIAKHAHGTAIWYYRSGKKMTARTFRDGKLQGAMVSWYEDGKKKYAVNYTDNLKNGEAKGWYKNEKNMFVIEYDHGKKHGKETWYWDTGAKKFEYTWYQGRKTGVLAWDNKGEPMKVPPARTRQPIRQPVKGGSSKKNR
jgi:antitoxin component YwqK of YwqJK toxin-antitoxin module